MMIKFIINTDMYLFVIRGRFLTKSLYKTMPFEVKYLFLGMYISLSVLYFVDKKINIL